MRNTPGNRAEDSDNRDSVRMYLDEIGRIPLIDAAEEVEKAKRIEAGLVAEYLLEPDAHDSEQLDEDDKLRFKMLGELMTKDELEWLANDGRNAMDEFVTANLRLAVSYAGKHGRDRLPFLDLIQEENTAIIHAVEKFDYTKGYKFSTYATWWLRQTLDLAVARQSGTTRLPVEVIEHLNKINGARRGLENRLGYEPSAEEIAGELGMDVDRVINVMKWTSPHISFDANLSEDGTTVGDVIVEDDAPSSESYIIHTDTNETLHKLVDQLPKRAADIISLKFGLIDGRPQNHKEIAEIAGVHHHTVGAIVAESLVTLRKLAEEEWAS